MQSVNKCGLEKIQLKERYLPRNDKCAKMDKLDNKRISRKGIKKFERIGSLRTNQWRYRKTERYL